MVVSSRRHALSKSFKIQVWATVLNHLAKLLTHFINGPEHRINAHDVHHGLGKALGHTPTWKGLEARGRYCCESGLVLVIGVVNLMFSTYCLFRQGGEEMLDSDLQACFLVPS